VVVIDGGDGNRTRVSFLSLYTRTLSAVHGKKVVLVTHDWELTVSAPRVIELRDGPRRRRPSRQRPHRAIPHRGQARSRESVRGRTPARVSSAITGKPMQ
jgi:hypothetical protein